MNNQLKVTENETEPKEQSEWDEWKENDDARRYREYKSDNQRPY
jgi:hypothetical protein